MTCSKPILFALLCAAAAAGQPSASSGHEPGARLTLLPADPLAAPQLPASEKSRDDAPGRPLRPTILDLKPAADPIYLDQPGETEGASSNWRTYSRPKVDPVSHDAEGIAIGGYDVVAYLDGRAERGRAGFSASYHGATWQFASAEHRGLFVRDPERYFPAYGGFCAYSVGKGYPATADPRVFAVVRGRLYLFYDAVARSVWAQDQRRLAGKADDTWPRLHR